MKAAAELLCNNFPDIVFSSVYSSAPQLKTDQDDFLNTVARFESDDSPEEIFATLQGIERELKKNPPERYGPRTIDLDLLLVSPPPSPPRSAEGECRCFCTSTNKTTNTPSPCNGEGWGEVVIPHPRMHERRFVLEPLCELIDPKSEHPTLKKIWATLKKSVEDQDCVSTNLIL